MFESKPTGSVSTRKQLREHFGERLDGERGGVTNQHYVDHEADIVHMQTMTSSDIHNEHKYEFMHRTSKDKYLTLPSSIHTVNPRHPSRMDRVKPMDYARLSNALQLTRGGHYDILGKRKAAREDIHINHGSSSDLYAINPHPVTSYNQGRKLEEFPYIVDSGDPSRTRSGQPGLHGTNVDIDANKQ